MFSLNLYKGSGRSGVNCAIRKSGVDVAYANVPTNGESGWYGSYASTVLHLNRGDTVYVGDCSNPGNILNYTSFIGFLLKAD